MSNKKQTYINNYFKSVPKSTKLSLPLNSRTKKIDMNYPKPSDASILSQMEEIITQLDLSLIKLPFPIPRYRRDSDENVNDVDMDNNLKSKRKAVVTGMCEPSMKKVKETQPMKELKKKIKTKTVEIKETVMSPMKISNDCFNKNKENNNEKIVSSPTKQKITTYIGVYSPTKKPQESNSSALITESTSKDIFETSSNDKGVEKLKTSPLANLEFSTENKCLLDCASRDNTCEAGPSNGITTNVPTEVKSSENVKESISGGEWNPWSLGIVKKIVNYVLAHKSLSKLMTTEEVSILNEFLHLPKDEFVFFCIKLYTRIRKWYNIFKLKNLIQLQICDREVMDMYVCLNEKGFVDTDYSSEPIELLLELLLLPDIRDLCVKFKLTMPKKVTRDILIEKLKLHCNSQSTLTHTKSTQSVLLDRIKEKMGYCIKMSTGFYNALQKAHVLYKLGTSDFQKVNDLYFLVGKIRDGSIVMPQITVNENFELFSSISTFSSFQKAYELHEAVLTAIENRSPQTLFPLCTAAYEELKIILLSDVADNRPSCIQRFTAGYQYTKALSTGLTHLTKHNPDEVNKWLQFLLQQRKFCKSLIGSWYNTLLIVQYTHMKQHRMATQTLIEALKEQNISKIDLIELNCRAEKIKRSPTYKVSQLEFDEISSLQPISMENFPYIEIDANAIRKEGVSGKRDYYENTENGMEFFSVEVKALKHYFSDGFTNGLHCEGSLIVTIFFVLFWDIIYTNEVPYAFISELQFYPLDLMSREFYTTREDSLSQRLFEIEFGWSLHKLQDFTRIMWTENSHKKSFINSEIVDDPKKLFDIILCIGRVNLRKILEHLVMDFRSHRSGVPDLFVWNTNNKKCKFVEVKGENDQLSSKQKYWLDFLRKIGADVEVCHVHTIGSQRKWRGNKQ